jgi:hypothetical protein
VCFSFYLFDVFHSTRFFCDAVISCHGHWDDDDGTANRLG